MALILILCACTTPSKNKRNFLSSVDNYKTAPQEVFTLRDNIYIKYIYEDTEVYLKAKLPKEKENPLDNYSRAELSAAKDIKDNSARKKEILYVSGGFENIITDFFKTLIPQGSGKGVIVIIQGFEGVLFRDENGKADFKLLTELPENIEIVGKINESRFTELFLSAIKKDLRLAEITDKRFLIPTQNKPTEPYIYLDLENNIVLTLTLPEYFELKKQMTELGFSISFIYSFLIKSHIFGIIKAPFTSTFRLLSLGKNSVYSAMAPLAPDYEGEIPP